MSNVAVLTDTAKSSAQQTVFDFGNGVYKHIYGDYGGHTQIRITATPYLDSGSDRAQDAVSGQASVQMRILSTENVTDYAVVVPVMLTGTLSAIIGQPPLIIRGPQNQAKTVHQQMFMDVYALSDVPLFYQWQKAAFNSSAFSNLSGKNSVAIVLPNLSLTRAGIYRVVVSNANGTVVSSNGTLTVSPLNPLITQDNSDDFGLPSFFVPPDASGGPPPI